MAFQKPAPGSRVGTAARGSVATASVNFVCPRPARSLNSRDIPFVASRTLRARSCPPGKCRRTGSANSISSTGTFSKICAPLFSAARARPLTIFPGSIIPPGTCFTARTHPGIRPGNRRIGQSAASADLVDSGKSEIAIDRELLQDGGESGQHISQAGKIAGSRLRQHHAACVAARTCPDRCGFEQNHGLVGRESPQPRRRRQVLKILRQ